VLEKLGGVYFILRVNPFAERGQPAPGEKGTNEAATRIVRNQILIRGAPVVARSLTVAGTAAMASGIAIHSQPVKPKPFLSISPRDRKAKLKHHHGKNWKSAWRAEKRKFVHYDPRNTKDVTAQQLRAQRRVRTQKTMRATTLRGAGGAMLVAGRLVPTIALGMVASSYIKTDDGRPLTQPDLMGGHAHVDLESLGSDTLALGNVMADNVMTVAGAAATGIQVGTMIIKDLV